jgi:lipoyl(octanoyl) transferase
MNRVIIRQLGRVSYQPIWYAMRLFTHRRQSQTSDEIWCLEHDPVFTLGQAGRLEHIHHPGEIPVVRTDRGGQVTYHGPGQLVFYTLFDIRRRRLGIKAMVHLLEQAVIDVLADYDLIATRRQHAPGVYIEQAKIAALGLRVHHGCSYHGLALNVDMDLQPFAAIDPCGYAGLPVTQLAHFNIDRPRHLIQAQLLSQLVNHLTC